MRSGAGKMLLASAGLVLAAALFWATGEGTVLLERTEQVSATIVFDEDGVHEAIARVGFPGFADGWSRPGLERTTVWVRHEDARRSTVVSRTDVDPLSPRRVRDGLDVNLDVDEICPEAGDCVLEVPLRFEGRPERNDEVFVGVTLYADTDEPRSPSDDTDAEPDFFDFPVEVELVEP